MTIATQPEDRRMMAIALFLETHPDAESYFSESFWKKELAEIAALIRCGDDAALGRLVRRALDRAPIHNAIDREAAAERRQMRLDMEPVNRWPNHDRETGIALAGPL